MIYIKKVVKQDVTRSCYISNEAAENLFALNLAPGDKPATKYFKLPHKSEPKPLDITCHKDKKEIRILGFKSFLDRTLSKDDILIFQKEDENIFICKQLKFNDYEYKSRNEKLLGRSHMLEDNEQLFLTVEERDGNLLVNEDPPVKKDPIPLNQILYGPPGTGKTYSTIDRALKILDRESKETNIQKKLEENREIFKSLLNKRIFFVTMHPSYGYEDFVQGIRPKVFERKDEDGKTDHKDLTFEDKDGIFKLVAEKALASQFEDGESEDVYFENRDIARTCFFLSKYNSKLEKKANSLLGYKNNREAYDKLGTLFNLKPTYINNLRDQFDYFCSDDRIGHKPKGNKERLHNSKLWPLHDVYMELEKKSFDELSEIVSEIIKKPGEKKKVTEENQNFVLILDEINRANISKVFGELITLLEEDKRIGGDNELSVTLPSGEEFSIPPNLYIIGTMNTADKSIALVDIALRRRFQFEALYPDPSVIDRFGKVANSEKKQLMEKLNQKLIEPDGDFFKGVDFQIGHAYFLKNNTLNDVVDQNIIPLLTEYFRNDLQKVKDLLDACSHEIDNDHFEKTGLLISK
jgi:5-methylcytosine-specific restriction protein B